MLLLGIIHLNTTLVKVNQLKMHMEILQEQDLNTTLVKVNHALAYYLGEGHSDLNTTLVKVNQNENKRLNKRA